MIDHILGRPNSRYRKLQILAVTVAWIGSIYAWPNGPFHLQRILGFLQRRLTLWQIVVLTCLVEYVRKNLDMILGLECPEPLAGMYDPDYFRATYITTALDAGFWKCMRVRPRWLRDIGSMICTGYYLICPEKADEVVRKFRGKISEDHLRVSWEKSTTPYLRYFTPMMRPRRLCMKYKPRPLRIDRPRGSPYTEPVYGTLYFDGPRKDLLNHDKLILDIPGGGFVAMDPRHHEDKLMTWATKTGLPVLALKYGKASQYPYPYALNECYDAYWTIMASFGTVLGLPGTAPPKVILSGDSAGGNLAVGLTLMLLSPYTSDYPGDKSIMPQLPMPLSLILIYPALDLNIASWLSDDQVALIQDPNRRAINEGVIRRKTEDYNQLTNTPTTSDDKMKDQLFRMTPLDEDQPSSARKDSPRDSPRASSPAAKIKTHLRMSSMIAYLNDRVLSPDMLRGMIMLYLEGHTRPDFQTNYFLSPLLAPESLLEKFPKVYLLCGEVDPLSDDSLIFAGRIRQARLQQFQSWKEMGVVKDKENFNDEKHVHLHLVSGVSHGFLQFASVYPRGWEFMELCSSWMKEVFIEADAKELGSSVASSIGDDYFARHSADDQLQGSRPSSAGGESSDSEDGPLRISTKLLMTPILEENANGQAGPSSSSKKRGTSGRGGIKRRQGASGRKSPTLSRKPTSLGRLSSSEDLMGRRMSSLTGALTGEGSSSSNS